MTHATGKQKYGGNKNLLLIKVGNYTHTHTQTVGKKNTSERISTFI